MRTLTSLLTVTAIMGVSAACALTACGDDTVKPGGLEVSWTQGAIATCESRRLVTVEARTFLKGELIDRKQGPCPSADRKGTLVFSDLAPGSYTVEVEGLESGGKGTYLGVMDKVPVREDKVTELDLTLTQKPARIQVLWSPPGTGNCAGNDVRTVTVSLVYDATTTETLQSNEESTCSAEFTDDNGDLQAGLLFEDLTPNNDVVVVVVGQNEDGDDIARVVSDSLALGAGDNLTGTAAIQLELLTCPGMPPVCP